MARYRYDKETGQVVEASVMAAKVAATRPNVIGHGAGCRCDSCGSAWEHVNNRERTEHYRYQQYMGRRRAMEERTR